MFDFRHQSEGEAEHFAVDGIVERIPLFGRVEVDALLQTLAHDGHNVRQRPAQARHLRDNERIAVFHALQQTAELAVAAFFLAADDFRYPMADEKISTVGETPDFILLVSQVLFAGTNSQIAYDHTYLTILRKLHCPRFHRVILRHYSSKQRISEQ